jgi:serine/threonine protein kinase/class 3 adenylate cyclase
MADLKTILFTDIVGSVELKREMPGHSDSERDQAFIVQILKPHRERIERELAALGGRVVSTAGDGNFLVFSDTISAARWAMGIQRSHRDDAIRTPKGKSVSVRISMHVGIPQTDPHDPNNFVGKPVDYAARLNDYATGDQILVSRSVVAVLEDAGMDGIAFHNHGRRELKGIGRVEIYELLFDRQAPRQMRPQPREIVPRQWSVLPATMGLSEFRERFGRAAASERRGNSSDVARPTTDVVPLKLGNYELGERLGSGGMGDVYRARHSQFGRVRAVKVIKQQFVDSEHDEVIRRFYQEIKAVGALEHPNIVVAIDSSAPTDSVHYLVMEYIEGVAADELVSLNGPLDLADACEIGRQAARGLAYIHQHGMVHRDIKPSNLMLTLAKSVGRDGWHAQSLADGRGDGEQPRPPQIQGVPGHDEQHAVVKILDLGLALLIGDDQQRLTMFDNRAMGTAMYMSPEQWKTTSVDIRADIYSLGCSLYHLLAGRPPFWKSDLKPEKAHERESLPPIDREPALPPEFWQVLERMTAKNPNDRYSDPAEVAAALAPFAQGNKLPALVQDAMGEMARSDTHRRAKSETRIAKSAESDTYAGRPAIWGSKAPAVEQTRNKRLRIAFGALTLAAVVAIGWLSVLATARHESAREAVEARQHALQVAAQYANAEILKEINRRFEILTQLAADETLRKQMVQINSRPSDETLWKRLEEWLGVRKADNAKYAAAESWFIDDISGVQVARSPRSESTRGENFSLRDYFHGQGTDLPPETPPPPPIKAPHLSAVYRSKSTGRLKVAFSVPIENGRKGKERQVIGILAMSVDLGEFDVLQKKLPKGFEVVLLDLRPSIIDGPPPRRGLVLHHQRDEVFSKGAPTPWVSGKVLEQIDALLAADPRATENGMILENYRDNALTNDKAYNGAIQPVIDRGEDAIRDAHWLVIVQEPVAR